MASWRRLLGCPRNVWLSSVQPTPIYAMEVLDRQMSRSLATVHPDYATMMMLMIRSSSMTVCVLVIFRC